jgi:hypothetical protein
MSQEKKNSEIEINGDPYQITVKRLTFFDVQGVAPLLINHNMDFSEYWRYAFSNWLSCEPSIDFNSLSPEDGQALAALLPEPAQVMDWLVFREAKSGSSSSSFTGGQ